MVTIWTGRATFAGGPKSDAISVYGNNILRNYTANDGWTAAISREEFAQGVHVCTWEVIYTNPGQRCKHSVFGIVHHCAQTSCSE